MSKCHIFGNLMHWLDCHYDLYYYSTVTNFETMTINATYLGKPLINSTNPIMKKSFFEREYIITQQD